MENMWYSNIPALLLLLVLLLTFNSFFTLALLLFVTFSGGKNYSILLVMNWWYWWRPIVRWPIVVTGVTNCLLNMLIHCSLHLVFDVPLLPLLLFIGDARFRRFVNSVVVVMVTTLIYPSSSVWLFPIGIERGREHSPGCQAVFYLMAIVDIIEPVTWWHCGPIAVVWKTGGGDDGHWAVTVVVVTAFNVPWYSLADCCSIVGDVNWLTTLQALLEIWHWYRCYSGDNTIVPTTTTLPLFQFVGELTMLSISDVIPTTVPPRSYVNPDVDRWLFVCYPVVPTRTLHGYPLIV